jgi:hypothetical protein
MIEPLLYPLSYGGGLVRLQGFRECIRDTSTFRSAASSELDWRLLPAIASR